MRVNLFSILILGKNYWSITSLKKQIPISFIFLSQCLREFLVNFFTLTSSWKGWKKRGLTNNPLFFPRSQLLAGDLPHGSSAKRCGGGALIRPRRTALVNVSWLDGTTWGVRTWTSKSPTVSRSSPSLMSRFLTPLRLTLCAVWLNRLGSATYQTLYY